MPPPPSKPTPPAATPRAPIDLGLAALKPLGVPSWFEHKAKTLGIEFDGEDLPRLGRFLAMLAHANEKMNLTAITEPDKMWERHILDSLTLMQVLSDVPEGGRVLDIGTGGGLPGVPLAICMPHLSFTLLDGTAKKIQFLDEAIAALALTNAHAAQGRAEVLAHEIGTRTDVAGKAQRTGGWREQFDAVLARAVGATKTLAEISVPFAKQHALVALIKGGKAQDELADAATVLKELKVVVRDIIPTPTGQIVILDKPTATPRLFPRKR
jgi:16S rRNA (guanine527-N7)-methyltransferase